jgi:penicillin-binding protein 1C
VRGSGSIALVLLLVVALAFAPGVAEADAGNRLPEFAAVRAAFVPSDARLLDRRGAVLHELRVDANVRRLAWTPLAEISPALTEAVIASEDRRFRRHGGVDALAAAAAAWAWLAGGGRRGASTISMQVAALVDPALRRDGAPRSPRLKWAQMRAAWALEGAWSKDEILEAYLNLVTFRGELQGVGAASAVLFDKQPHGLTRAEALVLAALLRAPNAGTQALSRRAEWLAASLAADPRGGRTGRESASGVDLESTVARVVDRPRGSGPRVKGAPHVAARLLRRDQGRDVRSSLDASLQRVAAAALGRHLLELRGRHVADGAVLVADNATGEVRAYVGSSGELSPAPEVDGVRARRQAGSSLKPFLYAAAIDARLLTAASLLDDAPLEIQVGGGLYRPRNYDEQFRGLVSVRTALASSLNVPAVRTLGLLGVDEMARSLRQLGFALDRPGDRYGPSLALGSADVTLWELVGAYAALARGGVWRPLRLGAEGAAVAPPRDDARRVVSPAAAFIVADILADREGRSTTFGLESPLVTRFWTAVKTGTSKDMRDNWCLGFSRRYTVGVWVGNFTGRPMRDVSGISGAAPVWQEVMEWLHRDEPSPPPEVPPGVGARQVRSAEGGAGDRREWFVDGTEHGGAAPSPRAERPRIVSPAPGAVIAVDPDIPAERQRMPLSARGEGTLVLDGAALGPARRVLWRPQPGAHSLALVDAGGRILDDVRFTVRAACGGRADCGQVGPLPSERKQP